MSYDANHVGPEAMLEAIKDNTAFRPSIARSRVALARTEKTSQLPPMIQAALTEATSSNKRVFLDFYAEWCGACRTMDKTTFADASVRRVLDEGYVFLKVDTDEHPDIGKHFDVVGLPTVVALNQSGDIVYRHTGPLKTAPLLEQLVALDAE